MITVHICKYGLKEQVPKVFVCKIMKVYKKETRHLYGVANKKGVNTGHDCCVLQNGGPTEQLRPPFQSGKVSKAHPRISQEGLSPQLTAG